MSRAPPPWPPPRPPSHPFFGQRGRKAGGREGVSLSGIIFRRERGGFNDVGMARKRTEDRASRLQTALPWQTHRSRRLSQFVPNSSHLFLCLHLSCQGLTLTQGSTKPGNLGAASDDGRRREGRYAKRGLEMDHLGDGGIFPGGALKDASAVPAAPVATKLGYCSVELHVLYFLSTSIRTGHWPQHKTRLKRN